MKKILSNLKKIFWSSKASKGFTLIELLIVIAILGILATAVLSAINPVEQINRSRDTGTQSDAEQLLSAIQRFNASQGYFPWMIGSSDNVTATNSRVSDVTTVSNNFPNRWSGSGATAAWTVDANQTVNVTPSSPAVAGDPVVLVLGSGTNGTNELLQAYVSRITDPTYRGLYIYNRGNQGDSTYVCFFPQSQSFEKTATTRCNSSSKPADYPSGACTANSTTLNFICLP